LQLLKPGGRLGIILPESLFGSPSYSYIIEWLQAKASTLAVAAMPEPLFKTSGKAGTHTKVCMVVLEKNESKKAAREDLIFMADAKWCGHDSRGNPTLRREGDNQVLLDDAPTIAKKYVAFKNTGLVPDDHLGFVQPRSELVGTVLIPKYYDPELIADLEALTKTHDTPTVLGDRSWIADAVGDASCHDRVGVQYLSLRGAGTPPDDLSRAVRWLEANTVPVTALNDPVLVRKVLDQLATLMNGRPAAPTTIARKRAVFYGALRYAVELGRLESHPMDRIRWSAPRSNDEVDRRIVINPQQAEQLLAAVHEREPELTAFFGCLYYAALRPAEALHLRIDDCELPAEGWGWLHLTGSTQHAESDWSDSGDPREDRGLKHRARSAVRDVPAAPVLVDLLRRHVAANGVGADGRVFQSSYRRGPVSLATYTRAWRQAREGALTPAQQRSPLAKVPYHLRHAAVSLWLNSGVPATQVAEWAGHSVHVLLRVYAHCIDGQDESTRRRIEAALTLGTTDGS
jgi:integrase